MQYSSYIERLSELLMAVGRSAPRYQKMALLYPRSKTLQSNLSEYYVVVIRVCHSFLRFTRKSALKQLASTITDTELNSYRSDLDRWADSIKEEVDVLVAKKIEDESLENSRFRALSTKNSERESLRQKMKTKARILEACSSYDHETAWKQIRKAGNATLFQGNAEYGEWKSQPNSSTLIYTGKLGSGKSVILANIVDDLNLCVGEQSTPVTYFFCRHDVEESLKARTVLGSLVRQLLRPVADVSPAQLEIDSITVTLDIEGMLKLLQKVLPNQYKAYFVLDGLDECEPAQRDELLRHLQALQKTLTLHICISFRKEPNSSVKLRLDQIVAPRFAEIPEQNPDIDAFIEAELESCVMARRLVVGEPTIVLEIKNALIAGSQGMFLWAALQIVSLGAMESDFAIRQALADLPKDLSDTFSRILRRSEGSAKHYQRLILELVTVACRPLTAQELREALSVVPGDTTFNPARLLNDVYSTLACCGSLIVVDEEELTVRFVHHSVKQFLLDRYIRPAEMITQLEDANHTMAEIIATYLNYGVFDTRLSKAVNPEIKAGLLPSAVMDSVLGSKDSVQKHALKLLKYSRARNLDIGTTLMKNSRLSKVRGVDDFHFFAYAKSYWLHHLSLVPKQEPLMRKLCSSLLRSQTIDINAKYDEDLAPIWWTIHNEHELTGRILLEVGRPELNLHEIGALIIKAGEKGYESLVDLLFETGAPRIFSEHEIAQSLLWSSSRQAIGSVMERLLKRSNVDVNLKDSEGRASLCRAAEKGQKSVVEIILATDRADVNIQDGENGRTPLMWAASNGHASTIQLILATNGVDVNLKAADGRSPLVLAVEHGHEPVVKLLLERSEVQVECRDDRDCSPLSQAANVGYEGIVKLFHETGEAIVDSIDDRDDTPLFIAIKKGHGSIVKMLLQTGKVSVNCEDSSGNTPLGIAAATGDEAIVKLLLETEGVAVDHKARQDRGTPLSLAAKYGHASIVKLLLETEKVDVNAKTSLGATPLSLAAEYGHASIVKLLLETGKVDVNAETLSGFTPLHMAIWKGNEATVGLLLETGQADVNSRDTFLQSPLWVAARNGHDAAAKLLLETGKVEIDARDKSGDQSPLFQAVIFGHESTVTMLLAWGANVDMQDREGRTALSYAVEEGYKSSSGQLSMVKVLLDAQASVDLKDSKGRTPQMRARKGGNDEILRLLGSRRR